MPMLPSEMSKQKIAILFFALLSVVLVVTNVYFYRQATSTTRAQAATQKDNADLVEKVGKLIVLPEGETPSVATVTDPEKLKKDQPFFVNAQVGDKVLIYATARKAIMYSPKDNRIVEVAPLLIGSPAPIGTPVIPQ